ncbi:MAG: toprim domain-containing protein [Bauldia sp.]
MASPLAFADLAALTGGRLGIHDVPCPLCGPARRAPANRVRKVLRIWQEEAGFASFVCARCGAQGGARDGTSPRPARTARAAPASKPRPLAPAKGGADGDGDRLRLARRLWAARQPLEGSIGERYLREVRHCPPPYPPTMGFLPARSLTTAIPPRSDDLGVGRGTTAIPPRSDDLGVGRGTAAIPPRSDDLGVGRGTYPPAIVSAFAFPDEPEPGRLAVDQSGVAGIHLIRLKPDGSGKAEAADGGPAKIMLGPSAGVPIVLSPLTDRLDLILCEGVETGLSLAAATGAGVWAAGSASRLPALADAIPAYAVPTILAEADLAGLRHALQLVRRLAARGLSVELSNFADLLALTSR